MTYLLDRLLDALMLPSLLATVACVVVACGTDTCFGRGATSPDALGKLECNAHMRDEAARRSNEKEDMI